MKKKRTIRKPVPVETKAAGYSTKELEVGLNLLQIPHRFHIFLLLHDICFGVGVGIQD